MATRGRYQLQGLGCVKPMNPTNQSIPRALELESSEIFNFKLVQRVEIKLLYLTLHTSATLAKYPRFPQDIDKHLNEY